jgi:hypothetical protein
LDRESKEAGSSHGIEQAPQAQDNENAAHDDHQDFVRQVLGGVGGEGCGHDAADDESGDDRPQLEPDGRNERRRDGEGDEELGQVDRISSATTDQAE